jgi:hypothetical protein
MPWYIWVFIFIIAGGLLGIMVAASTHFKGGHLEDKMWRTLSSILATLMFMTIFGGAYFAGKQGWWWMSILFAGVAFFTIYQLLVPD